MKARKGLEEDRLMMEDPYKRKEALLQEELRMYSKKRPSMMELEKMSATNKGSIPYRSHKITLPDLGPIEFEQLDLPQLPSNVTLEKLLELAKQTTCNYLDVNQYLVYPSDEDSDDSIFSWGSGEDMPHYRQAAAPGGGVGTSEGSDFEELSCPSLVSDYEDDDVIENSDTDKLAKEVASHDQTTEEQVTDTVDDATSPDNDVINNDVTDVSDQNDGEKVDVNDDISQAPNTNDVTKPSSDVPSVNVTLDSQASHDLLTPLEEASPLDDLIDGSPDLITSLLKSVDPEITPPDSPDTDDVSHDCIKLAEPDPASLLPVIPPPVSHDQETTPTGSHDTVTSPDNNLDKVSSHSSSDSSVASGDEVADLDLD